MPRSRFVVLLLALTLLASTVWAEKHFFKVTTTGEDVYHAIALEFEVVCKGELPKLIREPKILEDGEARSIEWNQFPTHRLEASDRGYDILVTEEGEDGKPIERVAGFLELGADDRRSGCRHRLRARGLGFEKKIRIESVKWPLEAY